MHRRKSENYRAKDSFWISYSDMMAGMLFVFALILFMAVYQIVDLQKKKTIELETKEAQLSSQQSLLLDQEAELADKEALLASSTLLLQQQQSELDNSRTALILAQKRIDEQTALLASQQARIDKLVGLRSEIIEALRDKLQEAGLDAAVDKNTGAIAFSGAVLFDIGRNELKDSGKELLNRFIPIYLRTLMSSEYDDYIGEIIIEGHTDTSGSYLSNMRLSQERALAVVHYCFTSEDMRLSSQEYALLQSVLTVNGRSYADPVYAANGTVDMDASRRVVFKFRMKDAEMIDQMSAILEGAGDH
ncbi:MAG: OmpA family protein [Clostridiales bacterium]|nr:OmpA family protein [Clostridiales bacterium]